MSPRAKLRIANVLMSVGLIPLAFFVVWLFGMRAWMHGYQPWVPLGDPLGMLGLLVVSFIMTLAVAGIAAAWSWDVARAHPQQRSRTALGLRLMTATVLASPFVLMFLI